MDYESMRRSLNTGTIGLNYLDTLAGSLHDRAHEGRHAVAGMRRRAVYEADVGWDELMAPYAPRERSRQGATSGVATSHERRPPSPAVERREQPTDRT